jgi:hypothetical protein
MMRTEIDGSETHVEAGTTVLEAVRSLGGDVPTLCFDERQEPFGACRVRMVDVAGAPRPVAACTTPCRDGMAVDTLGPTARRIFAATLELVLSELPEPPAEHSELAAVARARRRRRATLAGSRARARPRPAAPVPRSATGALHLVRALRAVATRSRARSR